MRRTLPTASLFVLLVATPSFALGHRVVGGDTLSELAVRYGVSVSALKTHNGLKTDLIRIGQVLQIPEAGLAAPKPRYYRVRSGDTLSHIALRARTTVATLKRDNGLQGDLIRVGQLLRLPAQATASSTHTVSQAAPAAPKPSSAEQVTVRSGDTLSHIAARTGTSVQALMQANGLVSHLIHPGQRLNVTGSASAPASSAGSASRRARIRALGVTDADVEVLARIIKGETPRHTPYAGQVAVGAVVLNRAFDKRWPNSIRGVAHQRLQFSAYNANVRARLYHGPIPAYAWRAARAALAGEDPTLGATHYFNPFLVRPSWAKRLRYIKRIGHTRTTAHAFYR